MSIIQSFAAASLAVMVTAAAPSVASAAVATSFASNSQPAGLRGQTTSWTTTLRANGCALPGQYVDYFTYHDNAPAWRYIGTRCTNSSGRSAIPFNIPTNVNADNNYIVAVYYGNGYYAYSCRAIRVQVGPQ